METEKRKAFIINFLYFAILMALAFVVLKYGLPLISPFVIAFFIAYILKRPICFLAERLPIHRKLSALVMVLLFYGIIVTLLILLGAKAFSGIQYMIMNLP
ncbi:MAG: AI-2E family transporter, partial [Eubacterium sp.]